METKKVYVVITNSDLTEGRGREYIKYFCELEATAQRLAKGGYVQGTNCPITIIEVVKNNNSWFGPVSIVPPTSDDIHVEEHLEKLREHAAQKQKVIEKMRDAGFSEDDIKILTD
jgi:hypothetical protein